MANAATLKKSQDLATYVRNTGELPRDLLIGSIVLFTIRDGLYSRDQLEKEFERLDLRKEFLPNPDLAVNAFKKALSDHKLFTYALSGNRTGSILIRDMVSDNTGVTKHFVREIKDAKNQRLAFETVGKAVFYRPRIEKGKAIPGTERSRFSIDGSLLENDAERKVLDGYCRSIIAANRRYQDFMDDMKIRAMVRGYLFHLLSVVIKPGVYFTYESHLDELGRLRQLVNTGLGNGCWMDLIPIADLKEQREMVVRAAEEESRNELQKLTDDLIEAADNPRVTARQFATLKDRLDEVRLRSKEHVKRLGLAADMTEAADEVAMAYLSKVAEKVGS